jgi:hypothetical protein
MEPTTLCRFDHDARPCDRSASHGLYCKRHALAVKKQMFNSADDQAQRDALWSGTNSEGYLQAARLEEEAWESKERRTEENGK